MGTNKYTPFDCFIFCSTILFLFVCIKEQYSLATGAYGKLINIDGKVVYEKISKMKPKLKRIPPRNGFDQME